MKHFWLGTGILLFFLISGLLTSLAFGRIHEPLSDALEDAAEAAMEGEWEKAVFFANTATSRWEKYRALTAAVADHAPLEEMDAAFEVLDIYTELGWWEEFAALCAQLSQMASAMAESQAALWWNLL